MLILQAVKEDAYKNKIDKGHIQLKLCNSYWTLMKGSDI
jgi:hypothetical protein